VVRGASWGRLLRGGGGYMASAVLGRVWLWGGGARGGAGFRGWVVRYRRFGERPGLVVGRAGRAMWGVVDRGVSGWFGDCVAFVRPAETR